MQRECIEKGLRVVAIRTVLGVILFILNTHHVVKAGALRSWLRISHHVVLHLSTIETREKIQVKFYDVYLHEMMAGLVRVKPFFVEIGYHGKKDMLACKEL